MGQLTATVHSRASVMPAGGADAPGLVRGLGLWSATAAVTGCVIGQAIFLVGSEVARDTGSAALALGVWTIGGLLSLCGALCLAELGAAMARAGGMYAATAAIAAGLLRLVSFLVPAVATPLFLFHIPEPFQAKSYAFVFTAAQPLAAGVILLITAVNYLSVRWGGRIQLMTTSLKVTAVGVLILLGILSQRSDLTARTAGSAPIAANGVALLTALVPVMWAYSGWHLLGHAGEEVQSPGKNIPRALVFGMLAVLGLYVLANWVYLHVLAISTIAQSPHVASDVVEKLIGERGAKWMTVAMMVSALGTLHITVLSAARTPFAMARDGLFFNFAKRLQPVFRSPSGGLLFVGCISALLALTGTFEELFSLVIFALWIFLSLSAVALIRLRKIEPDLPRPYSIWGYPWTPLFFLAGGLAMTMNLWLDRPIRSSMGLGIILLGLPFYFHWRKKSDFMTSSDTVSADSR